MVSFPALAPAASAEIEGEIYAIEEMFVAPCCYRQQISIHQSREAEEMRAEVRKMVLAGRNRQEILEAFVDKYGTQILASPPAKGFFMLAYLLPPFSLACGALAAGFFIRRTLAHRKSARSPGSAELRDSDRLRAYSNKIEEELQTYVPID